MLRRRVTADDIQMYWKVGYAHNPSIDTFEVQLPHKEREMTISRKDVEMVKGRDVMEPDWVERPGKKVPVLVKAKPPLVDLTLQGRPREWGFGPGEDEDVPPEELATQLKVVVTPRKSGARRV